LTDLILSVNIDKHSLVLDYGCGVGRIAKELINRTGCTVIGVDISSGMRGFAASYVDDDRFFACSPSSLELISNDIKFDAAIAVWTLQHCLEPEEDLHAIRFSLYPGGRMFVVNNITRVVPTIERGWVNDGIDTRTDQESWLPRAGKGCPGPDNCSSGCKRRNLLGNIR
jgi:ubiquinone/menaquinone biosynthesis C-methylase UbiE